MSINKHHNFDYDGGSPDIPLAVGDRYYSQDLARDFNFNRDLVGKLAKEFSGEIPMILNGGEVTKGTGDTLNITSGNGYAKHQVKISDDSTVIPATVKNADLEAVLIEWGEQTNMVISSATLDGSTFNYVKVRYKEDNSSNRDRAKKSGDYPVERIPSFEIIVDSVENTDYDVLLSIFTGTTGGNFYFYDRSSNKIGSLIKPQKPNWTYCQTIGSPYQITSFQYAAMAFMSDPYLAFADEGTGSLRALGFYGGGWLPAGTPLSIPGITRPAITFLNSLTIAFIDSGIGELRAYSFNGATWNLSGSGLSIPGLLRPMIAALNSTDIALYDIGLDSLRTYRFSGSSWSMIGSSFPLSGDFAGGMTALNGTDIAMYVDSFLATYRWSNGVWSQAGSSFSIGESANSAILSLNETDIIVGNSVSARFSVFRFEEGAWVFLGDLNAPGGMSSPAMAAKNGIEIAFIENSWDNLSLLRFGQYTSNLPHSAKLI